LKAITDRMAAAAERSGRSPDAVRLVAVTKTVGIAEARALLDLGITDLGENRVDVGRAKIEAIGPAATWHMIGTVQRRKVRDVLALFDRIDSIDRMTLAQTIQTRCEDGNRHIDALLEINVSGEDAKHGFPPEALEDILSKMALLDRIRVRGLMTMAPWGAEPGFLRGVFRRLRELAGTHGLEELSMGMTDDFEIAIEEGATQVRIGRALFA